MVFVGCIYYILSSHNNTFFIFYIPKLCGSSENYFKLSQISKKFSNIFTDEKPHMSRPMQFKPMLFKCQLYVFIISLVISLEIATFIFYYQTLIYFGTFVPFPENESVSNFCYFCLFSIKASCLFISLIISYWMPDTVVEKIFTEISRDVEWCYPFLDLSCLLQPDIGSF